MLPDSFLCSPGPRELMNTVFTVAPLREDFAAFPGEGVVSTVMPIPLPAREQNRRASSLPLSLRSRQSPTVGQRKFGEGRREENAPGRFCLSEPGPVLLGTCDPGFSFQIHLFIFSDCWPLLRRTQAESIPTG